MKSNNNRAIRIKIEDHEIQDFPCESLVISPFYDALLTNDNKSKSCKIRKKRKIS